MNEPFICLCSEITRENAFELIRWMEDDGVREFLRDTRRVCADLAHVLERVNLPVLTHLFNSDGRLYIACDRQNVPVGFVRLVVKGAETELVVVIGDRENWGRKLGSGTIRESLKTAFFELRAPKVVAKIHKGNIRSIRAFSSAGFRLAQETPALLRYEMTMEEYLMHLRKKRLAPGEIFITPIDRQRLKRVIDESLEGQTNMDKSLRALEREINRAKLVESARIAPDVVTMNSRAIVYLDGKERELSLVYPHEAELSRKCLSVLSPVGTAILGYREGNEIQWQVPSGVANIKIGKILYQPEAAGDYHL